MQMKTVIISKSTEFNSSSKINTKKKVIYKSRNCYFHFCILILICFVIYLIKFPLVQINSGQK